MTAQSVSPDNGSANKAVRSPMNAGAHPDIRDIRESIDNIDAALVHLLAERFKFTRRVGELKAESGIVPKDEAREARQIARLREIAVASGLDPMFVEKFQGFIVAEVVRLHHRIAGTETEPDVVA